MSMAVFPAQHESVNASTYDGAHLFLTLDDADENLVLELVRSDQFGMFVRNERDWEPINPDDDNPRVWDRTIIDVTNGAIAVYDIQQASDTPIQAGLFKMYELDEGDLS